MKNNKLFFASAFIMLLILSCKKEDNRNPSSTSISVPALTTVNVTAITKSSVSSGGNITSESGSPVTARGVCWSTNQNPTVSDGKTTDGSGTGSFTSSITGLEENTTYYVSAYAANSAGIGYGSSLSFTTLQNKNPGTVTDIDSNVYNIVTIGAQTWMKENLKVTKYRNGDFIPTKTGSIPNDNTSKFQWAYNNNNNNVTDYGRLYTWWVISDTRGVCPIGWHVPSDAEWCTLENFAEINVDSTCSIIGYRGTSLGDKLKEAGTTHWSISSVTKNVDNSSGFTALPGGSRSSTYFSSLNNVGYYWSATQKAIDCSWSRTFFYNDPQVFRCSSGNSFGLSIRCIRD